MKETLYNPKKVARVGIYKEKPYGLELTSDRSGCNAIVTRVSGLSEKIKFKKVMHYILFILIIFIKLLSLEINVLIQKLSL
eukprot:UN26273